MYRKLIHVFILSSLHLIKHAFQETTSTYDVIFKRNERVDIEVLHMINPRNAHLLNLITILNKISSPLSTNMLSCPFWYRNCHPSLPAMHPEFCLTFNKCVTVHVFQNFLAVVFTTVCECPPRLGKFKFIKTESSFDELCHKLKDCASK